MNRRLALIFALGALLAARRAFAQVAAEEVTIGYQGLPHKSSGETNTGINIAEGMMLHVGAGVEAGYDSNVFYTSPSDPNGIDSSGILRFTTFGEITNATRVENASPTVTYDARAGLVYRRYTSDNPAVEKYRDAFMPTAGLSLGTGSGHWSYQLMDTFVRLEDPPYQGNFVAANGGVAPPTPITRDSNLASAQVQWAPGGGRITSTLRYNNMIDFFEASSGFSYASSLTNQLVLDVSWKWLPKTAIFFQANQGWVTYLNSISPTETKASSYPLRVFVGLRGLITQRVTAIVALGYVNAFYASGATTSGIWGSTYADAQLQFAPTMLNRFVVGYHEDFVNSVISNFYYESAFYASYVQQLGGRLAFDLSGRYSHRSYEGLLFDMRPNTSRTDNTFTAGATLDYFIRNWAYCGVGYSLAANVSDYTLPGPGGTNGPGVSYTKHQVFARLGVTY